MPPEQRDFDEFLEKFRKHRDLMTEELHKVIVGQDAVIEQILAAIFTGGHCLLVGVPGLAKTLLVSTIARILDVRFKRIQFTPDLMPSDITGTNVLEEAEAGKRHFRFVEGPVFTNVLLADEINRTPPKTQAALLQAMQEHEVTIGQTTYPLPEPFFVIATQNPSFHVGTFPLPESQLDRFLMRIELGYPDPAAERALLAGQERRTLIHDLAPVLTPAALVALQGEARQVHTAAALLDYVQNLLTHSRRAPEFGAGLSPRAGLALLNAARAWAFMHGRGAVLPEDVQAVLPSVVGHRLHAPGMAPQFGSTDLARKLAAEVAIP